MMFLIELKFDMLIVDHHSLYYINICVSRRYSFLQDIQNVIHLRLRLKIFEGILVLLNYLHLYKINAWYIFFIMYGHHWK